MKPKYIAFLFAATLATSACSIDEIKPYHKLETENVVYNQESAEAVLRGVYRSWRTFNIATFRPYMSILSGFSVSRGGGLTGGQEFITNALQANNVAIATFYEGSYLTINTANNLIVLLERGDAKGTPEIRIKEMIAECKTQRALAHFQLLRHYGYFFDTKSPYGIVLRDKPFEGTQTAKRATVKDSYSFILNDLDYAINNGPSYTGENYYVSRLTAKALKAKVLLHMKEYLQAETIANQVINEAQEAGYALETNYKDIFTNGYESTEALFATYTEGTTETLSEVINRTTYSEFIKRMADNLIGANADGNLTTGEGYDHRFFLMFNPNLAGPLGNGKYPYNANGPGKHNTQMILRLSEIYLIHAEAAARNGNFTQSKESLNSITKRANYPANYSASIANSALLTQIFQHKILELFTENAEDWFDFVRYYKENNINIDAIKTTIKSASQLVLPLPLSALAGNNSLEQNPI